MKNGTAFFANKSCQYFPCHPVEEGTEDDFNCMFCYCPMHRFENCPGTPSYFAGRDGSVIKDCSSCTFPHQAENYEAVVSVLAKRLYGC